MKNRCLTKKLLKRFFMAQVTHKTSTHFFNVWIFMI